MWNSDAYARLHLPDAARSERVYGPPPPRASEPGYLPATPAVSSSVPAQPQAPMGAPAHPSASAWSIVDVLAAAARQALLSSYLTRHPDAAVSAAPASATQIGAGTGPEAATRAAGAGQQRHSLGDYNPASPPRSTSFPHAAATPAAHTTTATAGRFNPAPNSNLSLPLSPSATTLLTDAVAAAVSALRAAVGQLLPRPISSPSPVGLSASAAAAAASAAAEDADSGHYAGSSPATPSPTPQTPPPYTVPPYISALLRRLLPILAAAACATAAHAVLVRGLGLTTRGPAAAVAIPAPLTLALLLRCSTLARARAPAAAPALILYTRPLLRLARLAAVLAAAVAVLRRWADPLLGPRGTGLLAGGGLPLWPHMRLMLLVWIACVGTGKAAAEAWAAGAVLSRGAAAAAEEAAVAEAARAAISSDILAGAAAMLVPGILAQGNAHAGAGAEYSSASGRASDAPSAAEAVDSAFTSRILSPLPFPPADSAAQCVSLAEMQADDAAEAAAEEAARVEGEAAAAAAAATVATASSAAAAGALGAAPRQLLLLAARQLPWPVSTACLALAPPLQALARQRGGIEAFFMPPTQASSTAATTASVAHAAAVSAALVALWTAPDPAETLWMRAGAAVEALYRRYASSKARL